MRLPITLALVAAAVTALPAQVRVVRYGDDRLTGITAVDVVAGERDDRSASCGVPRTALQETTVGTLRAAGIKASISGKASSWFYTIYVAAQSTPADSQCATALSVELTAQVGGIPEADRHAPKDAWGSLLVGQMPLIRHSDLILSREADHRSRVDAALRARIEAIGAKIRAVNPPR